MDEQSSAPVRAGRGRRPAAIVRAEVLEAAATLLYEEGLRAVTFDRVAAKSRASKTTIYKWWPSPGALAAEAHFARSEPELQFPDTGDVYADVQTQLRSFVRLLTQRGGGRVIAELIGASQTDSDLAAEVSAKYTLPRRLLAIDYFERARERGQLDAHVDPTLLVDQLWGACYNRLLVPDAPLTEAYADALVANALLGAARTGYREQISTVGAN